MKLIMKYTRLLSGLGHEQKVYIPKDGTIDKLFERENCQYNKTEKGFDSFGFTFIYFNPDAL